MTTERLREVLSSRPRRRVAAIVAGWLALTVLVPLKWASKLPALPFLMLESLVWRIEHWLLCAVGSVVQENADAKVRGENDDEEEGDESWM